MKITADTTDEQLNAFVDAARRSLIRAVENNDIAEYLANAVNSVAEAEGEREARYIYRTALQNGCDHDTAMRAILDRLLNGAGDTWSGRGNDARRARFDGFRAAAQDLRWSPRGHIIELLDQED